MPVRITGRTYEIQRREPGALNRNIAALGSIMLPINTAEEPRMFVGSIAAGARQQQSSGDLQISIRNADETPLRIHLKWYRMVPFAR
jgi:hypothetical protein